MTGQQVLGRHFDSHFHRQNIGGKMYFAYGGAYYQPFYSGSSVVYLVVAKPA